MIMASPDKVDDPELEELLKNTLVDFENLAVQTKLNQDYTGLGKSGNTSKKSADVKFAATNVSQSTSRPSGTLPDQQLDVSVSEMENTIKSILSGDPQLASQFEHLSQAASNVDGIPPGSEDFAQTLSKTLESMTSQMDQLEDEIVRNPGSNPGMVPLMENMMRSLLSKDLLCPSIKEMLALYGPFLTENKTKLSSEEYDRYSEQASTLSEILNQYERSDAEELNTEQFEKVLFLMDKMQTLGKPPETICKDYTGDMPFGAMPNLPGADPQNCTIS